MTLTLAVAVFAFAACEKAEIKPNPTSTTQVTSSATSASARQLSANSNSVGETGTVYPKSLVFGNGDIWCVSSGGNCIGPIIINGNNPPGTRLINNSLGASVDNGDLTTFFTQDNAYVAVIKQFETDKGVKVLDDLKNGNATIVKAPGANNTIAYVCVKSSDKNLTGQALVDHSIFVLPTSESR